MSSSDWNGQPQNNNPKSTDEILFINKDLPPGPLQQERSTLAGVAAATSASKLLRVSNQADLEDEFGTDIIIPDGEFWEVRILESFTLTKPFKIGDGSRLEIEEDTPGLIITYTGATPLFQNENPANGISQLILKNIRFEGDGTNDAFDIVGGMGSRVRLEGVQIDSFANPGTWQVAVVDVFATALSDVDTGIILINPAGARFVQFSLGFPAATPAITLITIKSDTTSQVSLDSCASFDSNSSVLFFDPNVAAGAALDVMGTRGVYAELFQSGVETAVDDIFDGSGPGLTEFIVIGHSFVKGQAIVQSGFTDPNYNGTFIIVNVGVGLYEVETPFTASGGLGVVNEQSLDQTDPLVLAVNNTDTQNSMTISESSINGVLEVDGSGGTDVPIVDITPVSGDWIQDPTEERFSVDLTTGLVTYNGLVTITALIRYSLSAEQSSGGAQTLEIDLHINGVKQDKSEIIIISGSPAVPGAYNGGNFVLNPGDTLQLFKDNTTNTNNTDISAATLLVSRIG